MAVDRFRRGIEFEAFQAIRALARACGESALPECELGDIASLHLEKFAYMCSDVHCSVMEHEAELLAQAMIAAAKEYASGESWFMHAEGFEREITRRLAEFRDGRRNDTPGR